MEIVSVKVKKARGKHCVVGKLDKPRKVGKMMSPYMMGGCFSSAKEAATRASAMKDGSWRPKGSRKKSTKKSGKRRGRGRR